MAQRVGRPVVRALRAVVAVLVLGCFALENDTEELYSDSTITGNSGGWLPMAQRTEPKTFNPVTANDTASRDVIGRMHSDLIHINGRSLQAEPALASSWNVSPDGRRYNLTLRRGIRFSDGHQMDADDVIFTFSVYLDESIPSTQHDLLIVGGKPIVIRKTGTHTVQFDLASPYASAERLFDNVPILPRHLLSKAWQEGRLARAWGIETPPEQIAGLGPFRLKRYVPGERVILERNPYYWKVDRNGRRLPYLEGLVFSFVPNDEMKTVRFLAGDDLVIDRLGAGNFLEVKKREQSGHVRVYDAGPGLEYQFLVFNMNQPTSQNSEDFRRKQRWFGDLAFRRAVSTGIDRLAIRRLVFNGLADPIWGHVTPANRLWRNGGIPREASSIPNARSILRSASFSWEGGRLLDSKGSPVEFSILVSSSNAHRAKIATIVQDDLRQLGMKVSVVALESLSLLDRVFKRRDYDAALMAVDSGDVDPNSQMNVWTSGGGMHFWNLSGKPQSPWEEEIDGLMRRQMTVLDPDKRKSMYDRVQQLAAEQLPLICLTSPHVLVGASDRLGNFSPSILRPSTLWNADSLYIRKAR